MNAPMKYRLQGSRRNSRTNRQETFDTYVIASGYDDAQRTARDNWRSEWDQVIFNRVVQASAQER